MRRGVAMVVLAWSAGARADDASVSERARVEVEAPPEQRYGFSVRPRVEHIDGQRAQIELTDAASIFVTGTWSSSDREDRLREDDLRGHAWTAGAGASIDLGWAQLDAHATYGQVENELGVGAYFDLGVGLRKTFRITDTVTGFLSLTFGQRRWRGDPLPGEQNASTVMLSFGLRWR